MRACEFFTLMGCGLLSLLCTTNTRAGDSSGAALAADREWAVIVSPYLWAGSLDGSGSLAGFDTDINVPASEIIDHLDFVLMGNVEVTNGTWGTYLDAQHVRTSQDEELLSNEIGLDITTTWIAGGVFYKVWERETGGSTVFDKPRTISLEPTVGVRWTKLRAEASALGVSATKSADWTDPFVGLRTNIDLSDRWNIFAEADIGGFGIGSELSVNAHGYLGYRTTMFGKSTLLRAGYRVVYQDYENDDFTGVNKFRWDVTQHGPVFGFSVRF